MSLYNSFTGINKLPVKIRSTMLKYGIIRTLSSVFYYCTATIFVLHLIDKIDYKSASIILSVRFLVQLVVDYPSGSLADYIGQRWVLFTSYLSAGVAWYLFSLAQTFDVFVICAIIFGFSYAQNSGSLQSWLDNNYKKVNDADPEKRNYGFTMSRLETIDTFVMGVSIIGIGILSTAISRSFVFFLQSILITILSIMVVFMLTDVKSPSGDNTDINQLSKPGQSSALREYLAFLKGGLSFSISRKSVAFFVLGSSVITAVWSLWGAIMLFPIYFGYTGSDDLTGLLRSTIFFIGVGIQLAIASSIKKISTKKLPRYLSLHFFSLFIGIITTIYFFPLNNSFSLTAVIILLFIFTFSVNLLMPIINTLTQRITLDLVPSEYRNSIYSLMPTIKEILMVVLLPITGTIIDDLGMIFGVLVVLSLSVLGIVLLRMSFYFKESEIVKSNQPYIVQFGPQAQAISSK